MATTTFRRPTAKQIEMLSGIASGRITEITAPVAALIDKGWVFDAGFRNPALTTFGTRLVAVSEDIARVSAIPLAKRPNVSLRKRTYGRSWLGYEVVCWACRRDELKDSHIVWFTNDHEARDKWNAEVAQARHILKHIDETNEA